jgi:hypothetical protein
VDAKVDLEQQFTHVERPTVRTRSDRPAGHEQREVLVMVLTVIGGVSKVVVEVEDQEHAKAFWTETLGFELAGPRDHYPSNKE